MYCVCVRLQEVLVRQAGYAGSIWLGSAGCKVAALRVADTGKNMQGFCHFVLHLQDILQEKHKENTQHT